MMKQPIITALLCVIATLGAQAQSYPDKSIRIVSGTQTGTSGDLAASRNGRV